ncbi:MAG: pseudaminic acid synthase [Candidatus Obscuribacterales bacterium]
MIETFRLGAFTIGPGQPPFVIAELSGNHNQSLSRALSLVDAAAAAGAHAVKLQTYTADTMTIDLEEGEFVVSDPGSLWHGRTLYDLYEEAHTPWEWHEELFERIREKGMVPLSTPFDATAVDFLETLRIPAYKIASFELTDLPLIKKCASTGKPMIISTGMATLSEIEDAVAAAREAGDGPVVLLKCTSTYPASPENSNLATIPVLKQVFKTHVGLSDHTMGVGAAVASVAFGAEVIEKHFCLSRAEGGVDSAFSLEPEEFASLVAETRAAFLSIGGVAIGGGADSGSRIYRRSLYIVEDMNEGDTITSANLRAIRPGYGLSPKYFEELLGRKVVGPVKRGTPASWDLFESGVRSLVR